MYLMNNVSFINSESSSSDEKIEKLSIGKIERLVQYYISSNTTFKNICLDVEVIRCKDVRGMCLATVQDVTGSMSAIIYKGNYHSPLKETDKIKINCTVALYQRNVQLNITSYKHMGVGDSNAKFEALKHELSLLGYFDTKPELEKDYAQIGVISSLQTAGLKDFIHTINERCSGKTIYIYPSVMQGNHAPHELDAAISLANTHNMVQVIAMIRGGGAKEDLDCFNTKLVAKSIWKSKIPIVTGIGHQIDTTIADLASWKHYITPTAVAQNITMENTINANSINKLVQSIQTKLIKHLSEQADYLVKYRNKIEKYRQIMISTLDADLSHHQSLYQKKRQEIISFMKIRQDEIFKNRQLVDDTMQLLCYQLTDKFENVSKNLASHITQYEMKLSMYDEQIKSSARPYVISSKTHNEIVSIQDLAHCKTCTIRFIDGDINLNINR